MAGFTWDNEQADREADDELNYVEDSGIPGDGDTLTLDGTEGAGWEDGWLNANLPAAGTISYVFSGDETVAEQYAEGEIDTLHDGADFGTILVNLDTGMYHPGASGKVTMTLGTLYNVQDADVELDGGEIAYDSDVFTFTGTLTSTANGGAITLDGTTELTCSQTLTLEDSVDLNLGYDTGSPNSPILTADLVLNAGSTLYVNHNGSGTPEIQGDLTLSGGTIDWNGVELTVDGHLVYSSGTTTSMGNTILVGTHNIDWATYGGRLGTVELDASATITRTGGTAFEGLTIPAGATMDGASRGTYIGGGTGAKIDIQGTYSGGDLRLTPTYPVTNTGAIALAEGCTLEVITQSSSAWTQSGAVSTKDILVRGATNGHLGVLNLTGGAGANSLGAVILGTDASDQAGKIDFADQTHTLESIESKANGGSNPNQIDFGESDITISGGTATIDGTNATIVNVSAVIHGGTLSNVDASGTNELDATDGVIDGGGNVNVNFGGGAAGSMLLMGAGG